MYISVFAFLFSLDHLIHFPVEMPLGLALSILFITGYLALNAVSGIAAWKNNSSIYFFLSHI